MMFLLATEQQKEQIEGLYNNRSEIQFFEHNGKWLTPSTNLSNEDFADIMDILKSLPVIELPTQNSIE